MTIVHRFGNRYLLPPITQHYIDRKRQSSEQACVEVLRNFYTDIVPHTPAITELLIPYNPGGHWVTLQVRIRIDEVSHERTATLVYYESLRGLSFNKYSQIRSFLRSQGYQGLFDTYERKGFMQPDGVSCGPITVETVKRLFKGEGISQAELTHADCLAYKQAHRARLQVVDYDFDF